jgi:hypothetical protein
MSVNYRDFLIQTVKGLHFNFRVQALYFLNTLLSMDLKVGVDTSIQIVIESQYRANTRESGKRCRGKTPLETFIEGKQLYKEKNIDERLVA